jgi:hypothetical protein
MVLGGGGGGAFFLMNKKIKLIKILKKGKIKN